MKQIAAINAAILLALSTATAQSIYDDWMADIADHTYISQLSIPGSHDSATGHGFSGWLSAFGEAYARTQDKNITEQWQSGIRAFDLRPCVDGSDMPIYHGILPTNLKMDEALATLCDLLDQHPTEAAIVIVRHETDGDNGDNNWNKMMMTLLSEDNINAHCATFKPLLTMGEVRGKMLILSRDKYATNPIGGFINNWSHSSTFSDQTKSTITAKGTSTPCYVQDFYDCSASGAKATKTDAITTLLTFTATRNKNTRLWCINHTSGYSLTTSFFGSETSSSDGYRDNAATQNKAVIDFLTATPGPTGIIMMDYAATDRSGNYDVMGLSLTQAIIENNAQYEPKGNHIDQTEFQTLPSDTHYSARRLNSAAYYSLSGHRAATNSKAIIITEEKKIIVRQPAK